MTMLETVVTLLCKHWGDLDSIQNVICYMKIITKLKKLVIYLVIIIVKEWFVAMTLTAK